MDEINVNMVNEVINNICQKLGIGINSLGDLVPEFSKMNAYSNLVYAISCFIFIVFGVIAIIFSFKSFKTIRDASIVIFLVSNIVIIIALFVGSDFVVEAIKWYVAPRAKTIEYIINLIK